MFTISYLLNHYMYISCALQSFAKRAEKKEWEDESLSFCISVITCFRRNICKNARFEVKDILCYYCTLVQAKR